MSSAFLILSTQFFSSAKQFPVSNSARQYLTRSTHALSTPTMNGFLGTYLGEWKLEVMDTTQDAIRYHCNRHGGVTDGWHPEERLWIGDHGDVWKEKAVYPPSLSKVRAVKKINKEQTNFSQSSQRELHALATFSGDTVAEVSKNQMLTTFPLSLWHI